MLTGLGMIEKLLQTDADFTFTFLRNIAGIIIFPCGMQKLLGWFDGVGIEGTLEQMKVRKIPQFIGTCPEFRSEMPDAIFRIATSFSGSNSNRFGERPLPMEIIKGFHLSTRNQPNKKCKQIIGNSAALESVLSGVECVAPTDSTVLVLGETGTGKELISRAIHNMSGRRGRPFVTLSCAAIPFDLLESELFGHEKGAFTGAVAQKIGRFEMADTGTLFLDEIGDMPLALQPKLLRVVQEHEFERLGSCRTHRIDVRLIAATHRNLTEMVEKNEFRSDLYYRLNVFPIVLPPLRDRPEDIEPLIWHFVRIFVEKMGKRIHLVPQETLDSFKAYCWPGNVRELQNLIERAVILSSDGVLPSPFAKLDSKTVAVASSCETFIDSQRAVIVRALQAAGWRVGGHQGAAARLGLKRTTLIHKMKKLGISRSTAQTDTHTPAQPRKSPSLWQSVADSGDGHFPSELRVAAR